MAMAEHADQTEASRTWMLFESGNGAAVDLSLYAPPKERARPIDAYVVTECEGDFTGSARRAVEAVYDVLQQHGSEMDPVVVGYDLQGLPGGRPVTGESGGLAFAIALAKRILDRDPGPVAATGDITSGHGGGPVGPVSGIIAKLEAAGRLAPERGWVFYPQDNDREIPPDLRTTLTKKGLRLQPVSSVAETLTLLFGLPAPLLGSARQTKKGKKSLMSGLLISLLICATALLLARIHGWPPFEGKISTERKEMALKEAPVAVNENKAVITGGPDIPPSSEPPTAAPDVHAEIQLSGENGVAADLARLTAEQLEDLLKRKGPLDSGVTRISGRIVVLDSVEYPSDKAGGISSRMTVAVKGLAFKAGKATRASGELRLVVKGEGAAEDLLPEAASALARQIVKGPRTQEEVRTEEKTGKGFD
jgi:hypothetical protein